MANTFASEGYLQTNGNLKFLLQLTASEIDVNKYVELVNKGPCSVYQKMRKDTTRTFKTDREFLKYVSEEKLIRFINAFCHSVGKTFCYISLTIHNRRRRRQYHVCARNECHCRHLPVCDA